MVPERGVDHSENQRFMVLAAGRMGRGGLEPSAGSDVGRRPTGAVTPGGEMPEAGVDRAERQRPVVVVEMVVRVGVDLRPPAGSVETPRAKRASNPQK
jgi:hypothetical protein